VNVLVEFDDREIKALAADYRDQGSAPSLEKLKRILSRFILDYPRRVFFRKADECSAYFEYVCVRLPRVLKKYRQTEARFKTWFLVVLRNLYLNWLKRDERKELLVPLTAGAEREIDLADIARFRQWREEERTGSEVPENRKDWLNGWFKSQSPERRLLLRLLFGECDPEGLRALTKDTASAAALHAEYLRLSAMSVAKRNSILSRMAACQEDMVRLERSLSWTDRAILEPEDRDRQTARIRRELTARKGRLKVLVSRFNRLKYNMPYGWVRRVTGWSLDRIKRQLVEIRRDLGQALGMEDAS